MATISYTVSAGDITRLQNAFGAKYNYQETLEDGSANPESLSAFTKRIIAQNIKLEVKEWEESVAREAAVQSITDITIN